MQVFYWIFDQQIGRGRCPLKPDKEYRRFASTKQTLPGKLEYPDLKKRSRLTPVK